VSTEAEEETGGAIEIKPRYFPAYLSTDQRFIPPHHLRRPRRDVRRAAVLELCGNCHL